MSKIKLHKKKFSTGRITFVVASYLKNSGEMWSSLTSPEDTFLRKTHSPGRVPRVGPTPGPSRSGVTELGGWECGVYSSLFIYGLKFNGPKLDDIKAWSYPNPTPTDSPGTSTRDQTGRLIKCLYFGRKSRSDSTSLVADLSSLGDSHVVRRQRAVLRRAPDTDHDDPTEPHRNPRTDYETSRRRLSDDRSRTRRTGPTS